jgi:dihydroorotase
VKHANEKTRTTIHAGRIVCPASGVDGPGQVVIRDGQIESVELDSDLADQTAREASDGDCVLEFPDGVLLPGLIDLHAHPANSDSVFGVPPDEHMLARGVTTVMSQGDAGAANINRYVEKTICRSRVRVVLAINLSRNGEASEGGCLENLDDANVGECVDAVARHQAHVRAIAVNTSHHACGETDPREVLRRGILAAQETSLPILYGMRRPEDWPLDEQLALLRAGDIVTYCFRREPHCIVQNERVLDCVREARRRGILFDVGHGMGSFSFDVAEAAINDGSPPDTISTDLQSNHVGSIPQHDLPLTMSKLLAAGMAEADIFAAVSSTPAGLLGIDADTGAIMRGRPADLVVLQSQADQVLCDVHGQARRGVLWTPQLVVRNGSIIEGV